MNRLFLETLVAIVLMAFGWRLDATEPPPPPPQSHARYASLLESHVRDGFVDYRALKANPGDLDAYLDQLAAIPASVFDRWSRDEQLALLINLYNARTLRLIVDHHPVSSIRSIGLLPGSAWKQRIVRFQGRQISLDSLEHERIRPRYREPRVHFALVCAARSCPPLRSEPYTGTRLDEQLEDQARRFLGDAGKNRWDPVARILWLSPIFEWYAGDFMTGRPSLVAYVRPYLPEQARLTLNPDAMPEIRYTDYDWSLNQQPSPASVVSPGSAHGAPGKTGAGPR